MQREDKLYTDFVISSAFKPIYKRLGVKTNIEDEKIIFNFLQMGAQDVNTFNLKMLDKMC